MNEEINDHRSQYEKDMDDSIFIEATDFGEVVHLAVFLDTIGNFDPTDRNYTIGGFPFEAVEAEGITTADGDPIYVLQAKEIKE
jgi:hypothetical protein